MTIKKAIEILQDILRCVDPGDPPDEHYAIELGIEALKAVQEYRDAAGSPNYPPLPGETKN